MSVSFKTIKKHNVVIVKQPFLVNVYNKAKGQARKVIGKKKVQYVEDSDSIYVDDQLKINPDAKKTSIKIRNGIINVDDDNPRLIEVLRASPQNVANGGLLYKELDVAKEELYELEKLEKLDEARANITKANENTLRAAAVFYLNPNYINKTPSTIKLKLRANAEAVSQKTNDTTNFIDDLNNFFSSKNNNEKLTTVIAIKEGIIAIKDGKKMAWADSGEVIFISGQAKDVIKDFSVWLKSHEEGRQTLSALADKIGKLNP